MMAEGFQRGDRVGLTGVYREQWGDMHGEVTHFTGDVDEEGGGRYNGPDGEVWVTWDHPCDVGDGWMNPVDLVRLA